LYGVIRNDSALIISAGDAVFLGEHCSVVELAACSGGGSIRFMERRAVCSGRVHTVRRNNALRGLADKVFSKVFTRAGTDNEGYGRGFQETGGGYDRAQRC
jgi:hypothetical protein